jgi:hypothetical protein
MSERLEKKALIYESPDGGKTIRARHIHDMENVITFNAGENPGPLLKFIEWQEICDLADSNESLRNALDHVIMIYNLVKK